MLQPKLIKVEPLSNYMLKLFYDTNEIKIFDVKPYINGDWYNGQDISPHELYELSLSEEETISKI